MFKDKKMILASGSPRRKELLEQLGIEFEVIPSRKEEIFTGTTPKEVVEELSRQKAVEVGDMVEDSPVIIGGDTIVVLEGQILGKPRDEEDAKKMLRMLQGKTHQVYTGITVFVKGEISFTFSEITYVTMYPMSEQEIQDYVMTGEPLDKAGSYGIQGKAAKYIKKIDGDYNTVVGFPVARLYQELKRRDMLTADK